MESIHIIGENDSVLLVDLEEPQSFDNQAGEIVIDHLTVTRDFTGK